MPTYDFQCSRCNHKFSVLTSIAEKDKVVCPKCRSKEVRQLFTGCGVNLGGSKCDIGDAKPRFRGG